MGERAPERTLVAVRARAPVAGMAPKNGPMMLPTPCASSSESGSWRVRAMPSETTAESRDSMAPRMATAKAPGSRARKVWKSRLKGTPPGPGWSQGSMGRGGSCGIPSMSRPPITVWKRLAMVATWKPGTSCPSSRASRAAAGRATSGAGMRLSRRGQSRSTAKAKTPISSSHGEKVGRASAMAPIRSRKCSGLEARVRPSRSFSCSVAITVAMPAVKPVVTG